MTRARSQSTLRAGFTLLELMVVILIISILATFLVPRITSAVARAEVTACQSNLQEIGRGLIEYRTKYNRLPSGSGVAFFASLISDKVWDADQSTSKRMFCPAVDRSVLTPEQEGLPLKDWFKDAKQLDGSWSTYAGRDTKRNPLRKFPGVETDALVADDNDPFANHGTTTNVLWGNGAVIALELLDLQRDGTIPDVEDIEFIIVGPDSPDERLRALSLVD